MAGDEGDCPGRRKRVGAGESEGERGESVVEGGVIIVLVVEEGVKGKDEEESVACPNAVVNVLCSDGKEDST